MPADIGDGVNKAACADCFCLTDCSKRYKYDYHNMPRAHNINPIITTRTNVISLIAISKNFSM
jgi:hypothetical protein